MKISSERLPESQVVLAIEVEPERVEKSMDRAYRRLVGKYRVPGFRPGKAPRVMFERFVGREALLREALETLVPEVYEEAVKEESLDPIDQPKLEFPTLEPLLIKATVPLKPQVDLGEYRELRVPRPEITVDPEEVEKSVQNLRRGYATVQPVDRPVQTGDIIRADVRAEVDGKELLDETDADVRVTADALGGLPGLLDSLVGAEKGQSYDYTVDVPEDFDRPALAGKQATYHVTVHEVKEEILPELNDSFASEVGEGFASIAALRERIEADMRTRLEREADTEYQGQALQAVIDQATLQYPPVLVDREVDHMITEQAGAGKGRAGLETLLRRVGRSEQQLRDDLRVDAVQRVVRSLVLSDIAQREGISVDEAEVDAELDRLAGPLSANNASLRQVFDSESGREFMERTVLTRKVYDRLRDIAEGKELPPLPIAEEVSTVEAESGDTHGETTAPAELQGDESAAPVEPETVVDEAAIEAPISEG